MSKPQRDETAPSWLTESFMENALRKGLNSEDLKILKSEMKMATAVGDHYGSQMFRFNITFKAKKDEPEKNMSIIAKTIPSGVMGEELRKLCAFEKEEEAFSKILPAVSTLIKRAYPDHKKLWADCYYSQGAPNDLLLLEDLKVGGYTIASRFEGLDMEHSQLVLRSLAKLHAASLVLQKENPEKLEIFRQSFWRRDNEDSIKQFLTTPFKVLSEEVRTWEEFNKNEVFYKKLKSLEDDLLDKVFETWKLDESKLNVLLHGDSWVNNFMFKYDPNGKLIGINFVDFQLMNLNTPVMDLQYFIFTSVNPDLRFDNVDLFLQTYHEAFEETLDRLGHHLDKPYTLEHLKKDFDEKYYWGMVVFCSIFPLFVVPSKDALHPDDFFSTDNKSTELYNNIYNRKDVRLIFQRGLQFFEEKGAL